MLKKNSINSMRGAWSTGSLNMNKALTSQGAVGSRVFPSIRLASLSPLDDAESPQAPSPILPSQKVLGAA
jgi:hypothetical protein